MLILANDEKLEGYWVDNNIEGQGKFFTKDNEKIEGTWSNNILQ